MPNAARPLTLALLIAPFLVACGGGGETAEDERSITIWWAEWAPADGLAEMGERFEEQTGIAVNVHQIPWPSFQEKAFQQFSAQRTPFDILIGDSQWIGSAVEDGLYVELTDWLSGTLDLSSIHERAAKYLCEYPPGSGAFYAAPCETDCTGIAYRRDWFEDPDEKAAFQERYGYELAPPETWEQLRDAAEFFQRPDEKRYGVITPTGRGYDGMTMSFQQIMWAFGGAWADEDGDPLGTLNSPESVAALEFFTELVGLGPNDAARSDYADTVTHFKNGSTAMMINYIAFFPGIVRHETLGDVTGFVPMPTKDGRRGVSLGGQGMSISSKTPEAKQELCKQFIAWFLQEENQRAWVAKDGCFTADVAILESEAFRQATPFNAAFADSLEDVRDFWNIPEFNDLLTAAQEHLAATVDGKKSAQAALDAIAEEHAEILADRR